MIGALARALDIAFDLREGEPVLAEALAVSALLVKARAAKAAAEKMGPPPP